MNQKTLLLTLIILISCLLPVGTDIYAPSLPAVASSFNISIHQAQLSMAIYMLSVSVSLFFYGALSEVYGRKKPLITGMVILSIGSLICFYSTGLTGLMIGRAIQGIGAGACKLIGAMLKDGFDDNEMAKVTSYLHIAVGIIIPFAPAIGGVLQHLYHWHASFMFITAYSLICLSIIICLLKETSQHHHKDRIKIRYIVSTYRTVLTNPLFLVYATCNLLTFGALFSWASALPIVFQHTLGYSARNYGLVIFITSAMGCLLGSFSNTRLIKRLSHQTIIQTGWALVGLSGLFMLIGHSIAGTRATLILIPIFIFQYGTALVWPYTFIGAFKPFTKLAGYASAMFAATQLFGGFALGALVAYLPDRNGVPLSVIFIAVAIICLFIHHLFAKPLLAHYEEQ